MAAVDLDELETLFTKAALGRSVIPPTEGIVIGLAELRALITELRALRASAAEGRREWVKCSERLPAFGQAVLCIGHGWSSAAVLQLHPDEATGEPVCWSDSDGASIETFYPDDVTHWMPAPSPPEKGST